MLSDVQSPPAASLDAVERLYESGRALDALTLGERSWGPVRTWAGPDGRVLAGRVAMNLGGPRLGRVLHLRAHREHPDDPTATYYHVRAMMDRRGPLAAVEHCRRSGIPDSIPAALRAEWLSLRASAAAAYRDFATADRLLAEAIDLAPDRAWVRVEQAFVLEQADRFDEAMAAARHALALQPWMRPAVQALAHLLQVADRDREALDLLAEAADRLQSAPVLQQLAALQDHLRLYAEALRTLGRLDAMVPLRERGFEKSLAWVRHNVLYHAGDLAGAIAAAEGAGDDEGLGRVASHLRAQVEAGVVGRRARLELPFVRQHHMTCAPATLTAISRYWGRPADHLELVEAICYDGTPSYHQRDWAAGQGWTVREFRLTWDVAVALVDRGVPFTLATVGVGSAHLQAVVGYDPMRGTVLCRDPYQYYETELSIGPLLKYNAAFGPHCMVMVPPAEAHRLDGLDLPDADLHDLMHELERSLARHDRPAAVAARDRLAAAAPDHRLALSADRALASYDRDAAASLAAVDRLLARCPDTQPLRLWRAYGLRTLGRRDELAAELSRACDRWAADPVFLHLQAEHLRAEGADDRRVVAVLRRALRRRPAHPASLSTLGHVRWGQRRFDEAVELYRLTACADEKNERPAREYFVASRHLGHTDRAMAMLSWRFERWGRRSGQPGCTLSWAHEQLGQVPEAMAVLDRALGLRPDDGDLLLHAADLYGRRADPSRAREALGRARERTRSTDWLRAAARVAEYDADAAEALARWRSVLADEPTAVDANAAVARLLAQTESPAAAAAFLGAVCDRFPHLTWLHETRIMWLRQSGAGAVADAAARLVDQQPTNVWARVELALALATIGRAAEALDQAGRALALSPDAPNAHQAAGRAMERLGRFDEARDHFRRAVQSSVDYTAGLHALVDACPDAATKARELEFVAGLFDYQGPFGDGLLAFGVRAARVLPNERVERVLRDANAARPDVWQTWSALARFHRDAGQPQAAADAARGMVDRFSLLPQAWLDLGNAHQARGDRDGQIAALGRCLELSPGWSTAARPLATALRLAGDVPGAVAALRSAVARDPLEAETHDALAHALWASGDRPGAVDAARRAVSLDASLSATWNALGHWSAQTGDPDAVVRLARDLCGRRGGEAAVWLVLARSLPGGEQTRGERLDACARAVALSPTLADAHDLMAGLLAEAGRFDEAVAACDPPPFAGQPPVELRGRAAWVLDVRGDRPGAIAAMSDLLAGNPHYFWGWSQLVRWLERGDDPAAYLRAATDMAARFPRSALARNNLAQAHLGVRDRPAAKATLARSAELFPDDPFVIGKLFPLQLEDREYTAAAATLDLARRHLPAGRARLFGVRLAAATGDARRAAEDFAALCRTPDGGTPDGGTPVATAAEILDKARMAATVDRVLADVIAVGQDLNPEAAAVRARRLARAKKWPACRGLLARLEDGSPAWQAAVVPYLEGLCGTRQVGRLLRFVGRHEAALRRGGPAWGAVSYALVGVGRHRACVEWCHDWRDRADVQPWMLLNLATSHRRLGQYRAAADVAARAVSLPDDGHRFKHQLWLALDEVWAGRRGPATAAVLDAAGDRGAQAGKHYPYLRNVVRALAPLCDAPATDPAAAAPAARRQVVAAYRQFRQLKNRDVPDVYRRSARRIALAQPTLPNRTWATLAGIAAWFHAR